MWGVCRACACAAGCRRRGLACSGRACEAVWEGSEGGGGRGQLGVWASVWARGAAGARVSSSAGCGHWLTDAFGGVRVRVCPVPAGWHGWARSLTWLALRCTAGAHHNSQRGPKSRARTASLDDATPRRGH